MDLLQALNWRYATKKMDPTKSVPCLLYTSDAADD